jgi:hypothetical protein
MALTRKTPLKRKPWHPRRTKLKSSAPLKAISNKRAKQNDEYKRVKAAWINQRERENRMGCDGCAMYRGSELHHRRGRIGRLLTFTPEFRWLCRDCHNAVHEHPAWARECGLLAPSSEWNVFPG